MYIDGKIKGIINTYNRSGKYYQVLATYGVSYGRHTVEIVNQATSSHPNFIFDGVALRR